MKMIALYFLLPLILCSGCLSSSVTTKSGNVAKFLSHELANINGQENKLSDIYLPASWKAQRDQFGLLLIITEADYRALTNVLTAEFGPPILHTPTNGHQPFTLAWKTVGPSILVKQTPGYIELTIRKDLNHSAVVPGKRILS